MFASAVALSPIIGRLLDQGQMKLSCFSRPHCGSVRTLPPKERQHIPVGTPKDLVEFGSSNVETENGTGQLSSTTRQAQQLTAKRAALGGSLQPALCLTVCEMNPSSRRSQQRVGKHQTARFMSGLHFLIAVTIRTRAVVWSFLGTWKLDRRESG